MLGNISTGNGVMRSGIGVVRAERRYNATDHVGQNL